jgi:hypothetical protein
MWVLGTGFLSKSVRGYLGPAFGLACLVLPLSISGAAFGSADTEFAECPPALLNELENAPRILIVDPFSTGEAVRERAMARGYQTDFALSGPVPKALRTSYHPERFEHPPVATRTEDLDLDQIQQAGYAAVIAGSEPAIEAVDLAAHYAGVLGNAWKNSSARRHKGRMGEAWRRMGVRYTQFFEHTDPEALHGLRLEPTLASKSL